MHYFARGLHPANLSVLRGKPPLSRTTAWGCSLASQPAKFAPLVMVATFASLACSNNNVWFAMIDGVTLPEPI